MRLFYIVIDEVSLLWYQEYASPKLTQYLRPVSQSIVTNEDILNKRNLHRRLSSSDRAFSRFIGLVVQQMIFYVHFYKYNRDLCTDISVVGTTISANLAET